VVKRLGRPERIIIDGSQTNREAIIARDGESRLQDPLLADAEADRHPAGPVSEQPHRAGHRRIKRRIRSMLGFKSMTCAATILWST
jgi:putative transposase